MHAKYNKIFFNAQMDIDLVRASSPLLLTFSKTATESFHAKQPVYVRVPIYIYIFKIFAEVLAFVLLLINKRGSDGCIG